MSCAANAKNNLEMSKSKLYISEAFADQGPYLKRMQPRAKGRAYLILKPTCSITIKMMSHECVFGRLPLPHSLTRARRVRSSKRARPPIKLSRH